MKRNSKLLIIGLFAMVLIALTPMKTTAFIYSSSFNQELDDYMYLETTVANNATSGVTGFAIPVAGTNWMIEVDDVTDGPPWDMINVSVYQDTGSFIWEPTAIFGADSIGLGRYNDVSGFEINPGFEALFPVPFIVPANMTATFNYTLYNSLNSTLQNYVYINGTELMEMAGDMEYMLPFALYGIVVAWNGTSNYMGMGSDDPNGTTHGDIMLVAVYMDDGWLHYLRESWWDSGMEAWNTSYKMVSPQWATFGGMLESILPGAESSGGMIPGFPTAYVVLAVMVIFTIVYLTKSRKNRNIIRQGGISI